LGIAHSTPEQRAALAATKDAGEDVELQLSRRDKHDVFVCEVSLTSLGISLLAGR
jgi:hypothetical protein